MVSRTHPEAPWSRVSTHTTPDIGAAACGKNWVLGDGRSTRRGERRFEGCATYWKAGRWLPTPGQTVGQTFGQAGPESTNVRADVHRAGAEFGQVSARDGPNLARVRPSFAPNRPNLTRHKIGPMSAKFGPKSANLDQASTKLHAAQGRPNLARIAIFSLARV